MSQLLDLSITLTPPPDSASPEAIASIALRSDPQGLTHSGDLLTDPLTKQERDDLLWYLEEYPDWPYEQFLERAKKVEAILDEVGKKLYKTVFGSVGAVTVLQQWRLVPNVARQISIVSNIPRVLSLPWELLHDEHGFLALRTRNPVSIIRRLPQLELAELFTTFEPPLRVLLVTARPEGTGFIDPRSTAREFLDEIQSQIEAGTIALEFLRPPTLTALRNRLKNTTRPVHILHFDGHGVFEGEVEKRDGQRKIGGEQGKLAFEDDEGKLDLVEAETLADVLLDSGVRLAVLDACQSAMGAADDAFSSVATRLIQSGIDAVVAMSASILATSSTRFFEAFYREMAAGMPIPIAQERARQALHDDPRRHIHRRRRDEEGTPVRLRDWWLPHFYQQRPLELRPTKPSGELKEQVAPSSVRLSEDMPAEPRYGFSGRARELLQIERYLMRGKLVVIHGFGGNGKTALVREAADWLTRTKMYEGACFISFEHGGDATTLLSTLGNFTGVYDGNYNPNDTKVALARLKTILKEHPTMVIADNLESIIPGGEAPLEAGLRTQLWDVLLELTKMGAGVLLTTRDTNFGDGRLAPGKWVAYLPLGGLHPEDAYALASHLLDDLGIDRAHAPYAELRDLLTQLDYHPLAIQLVLPALREMPLSKIRGDFGSLLSRFMDDTTTGRNRSLLASLDYSLRRLSEEQRALLPRLAVFEGGASEARLLAITEIPEDEWVKLRSALEQAALIIAEHIHEGVSVPFLRFHPVLTPFLRNQLGVDDTRVQERYAQRYYGLVDYLYHEDERNPQPVRALVRREMPNLRRALELLMEVGNLEAASDMADSIATFMNHFGLWHERDEVRRRVAEAVTYAATSRGAALTRAEYLRESGLGEDEWQKGHLRAAYTRFTGLLMRIEALPEGTPLGRGSYEHCLTLNRLALCLRRGGQPIAAEKLLREALVIADALIKQQPGNQNCVRQRGLLLGELADVLRDRGQYSQARRAYEEVLKVDEQLGDLRNQAVDLGQLGTLMLKQRDYAGARSSYIAALGLFRSLGEPAMEATAWHQLGMVAQEQEEWDEAEHYYRESLAFAEQQGDDAGASDSCTQLGTVARYSGRLAEAEGWYKRALELDERIHPGGLSHAIDFSSLANLLVKEVQVGHAPMNRLAEALSYAERALAIEETLDASSQIWTTLAILANIAELEGHVEKAQDYRRRERETYAAFAGNRYHIDRQHGQLIAAIATAAKGDEQERRALEEILPKLEEKGWHISDATKRIWVGERDWHSLAEGIDRNSALLILRVLETIEQPTEAQDKTPEQVIASLPNSIREALQSGDETAFNQAFASLSPEEQQAVGEALTYLQALQEQEEAEEEPEEGNAIQQLEPLLQTIAAVAMGDNSHRSEIEEVLDELEKQDYHIKNAVQRIWAGERDLKVLTTGLDEIDSVLIERVLEIIAEPKE